MESETLSCVASQDDVRDQSGTKMSGSIEPFPTLPLLFSALFSLLPLSSLNNLLQSRPSLLFALGLCPPFLDLSSPPSDPWNFHSGSHLLLMLEGKQAGNSPLCIRASEAFPAPNSEMNRGRRKSGYEGKEGISLGK